MPFLCIVILQGEECLDLNIQCVAFYTLTMHTFASAPIPEAVLIACVPLQ